MTIGQEGTSNPEDPEDDGFDFSQAAPCLRDLLEYNEDILKAANLNPEDLREGSREARKQKLEARTKSVWDHLYRIQVAIDRDLPESGPLETQYRQMLYERDWAWVSVGLLYLESGAKLLGLSSQIAETAHQLIKSGAESPVLGALLACLENYDGQQPRLLPIQLLEEEKRRKEFNRRSNPDPDPDLDDDIPL
jgi:hypothetical protein